MRAYLYAWNEGSKSGRELASALGIKRIKHKGSAFQGSIHKTVVNWGASNVPEEIRVCRVINPPVAVSRVSNKLTFFELMAQGQNCPRIPEFTVSPAEALKWYEAGREVVARHVLNGHSGEGIAFLSDEDNRDFDAKLFTRYIKKEDEFRVHICSGEIIDVQRKGLRKTDDAGQLIDPKTVDFRVRSHGNGFVFIRDGINPHPDVIDQAKLAMAKTELQFGAVDVIWNDHQQKAFVLEINTAPGLEGQTIVNYTQAMKGIIYA